MIIRTDSNHKDFKLLVKALDLELNKRYGDIQKDYDAFNLFDYLDTVVICYQDGKPAGCGCYKPYDQQSVEIKRMFLHPQFRGKGIASEILKELEDWAKLKGYKKAILETGNRLIEAVHLYKKRGYEPIPKYGPYVDMPESLCFGKSLK